MVEINFRIKFLFFLFVFSFFITVLRLFQIQVIGNERFVKLAKRQFPQIRIWKPRRGNIYDSKGRLLVFNIDDKKRAVPEGEGWEPLIGFLNWKRSGASGIEYYWEDVLKGDVREIKWIKDGKGRKVIRVGCLNVLKEEGNSIFLSVDRSIQYKVYSFLKQQVDRLSANWGIGIVQEVKTGRILAFVYADRKEKKKYISSPIVSRFFEPGSTFKIIPAAVAIEENIVRPEDKFWCEEGEYNVDGFPIRDHEKYEWLTFKEIIEHSSNIGISKISELIGKEKLYFYIKKFGFGNYTGIRLPGETKGLLRKPREWSGLSIYRISFGQEIGVTALQLISAYSAIANNGILLEPHIVDKIETSDGRIVKKFKTFEVRRVISEKTSRVLKDFLRGVVENGTGKKAELKGYGICGKTGTAQKFDPELNTYSKDKYVSSFCGFFPKKNPVFSILIVFDEPEKRYYGGDSAAPVFKEVAEFLVNYFGIPPEKNEI